MKEVIKGIIKDSSKNILVDFQIARDRMDLLEKILGDSMMNEQKELFEDYCKAKKDFFYLASLLYTRNF